MENYPADVKIPNKTITDSLSNVDPQSDFEIILQENLDLRNQLTKQTKEFKRLAVQLRQSINQCDRLERSIQESREIYLLAIEAANLGIYDTEINDEDFKLKENWLTRLGYNPTLAHDKDLTWESLIHPDDYERVVTEFQKETTGDTNALSLEYRLRAANGEYRWIIESSKTIGTRRANGKFRIVGTHFDITERKLAEEAEREQRAFADALSATTAVFNRTLKLDKLVNLILVNVSKVVPNDDSDIWLLDRKSRYVHPAMRKDLDERIIPTPPMRIPVEENRIFWEIFKTRKPVYLNDIQPDNFPIPSRNSNIRSCLCTPVLFNEFLLGFLVVNSSKVNFFTETHIQRLQAFANQAGVAIRNAQLYSQAQEAAALEERQRLARDMHDVISQTLFSATMKAEALPYLLESEPHEKISEDLHELHRLTRGALAEMRTMLMELRPNAIINTDLANLITQMVDGLTGRTSAKIDFFTSGNGLLIPEAQTTYFRITQEAINNILKHSGADKINIVFNNNSDSVHLLIEDNGCGFNPRKISTDHLGLKIMRERAASISATLKIISGPGKGTKILLDWIKSKHGSNFY